MHVNPFVFHPEVLFLLLLAGVTGTLVRRRFEGVVATDHSNQFTALQASVLALLGLLLGFSFSMAVERFDERRRAEITEATAIGTAYVRASTLDDASARGQRELLRDYVQVRVAYHDARNDQRLVAEATKRTSELQRKLWAGARQATSNGAGPDTETKVGAYLSALTEMFTAAELRQAAYENRIPRTAWALLIMVAAVANFLVGLGVWRWNAFLLLILPVVVSSTLTLIYDLDSPRMGMIRVRQDSMERVQRMVEQDR